MSLGTIAEFQRRLDAVQINLAKVWDEGFEEGFAWAGGEERGVAIGEPVNPYEAKLEGPETFTGPDGITKALAEPLDSFDAGLRAEAAKLK